MCFRFLRGLAAPLDRTVELRGWDELEEVGIDGFGTLEAAYIFVLVSIALATLKNE